MSGGRLAVHPSASLCVGVNLRGPVLLGTDVNAAAVHATIVTCAGAGTPLGAGVLADLAAPLFARLSGSVDVLVFNPPYVPTPAADVGASRGLAAAWAGGVDGRQVTDRLLPILPVRPPHRLAQRGPDAYPPLDGMGGGWGIPALAGA
jgi:methylase of polypeptide subunit release factors